MFWLPGKSSPQITVSPPGPVTCVSSPLGSPLKWILSSYLLNSEKLKIYFFTASILLFDKDKLYSLVAGAEALPIKSILISAPSSIALLILTHSSLVYCSVVDIKSLQNEVLGSFCVLSAFVS